MPEDITLNGQDVFLQLIQGQSRIEAKLDTQIQVSDKLNNRVCSLETEVNQMKGERRFVKVWLPLIYGGITVLIALIPYIKFGGH